MTRDETIAIMGILRTAYPQYYKNVERKEVENAISLWSQMFSEDDPKMVTNALKIFIATDTKGFPPSIGNIKERVYELSTNQLEKITAMEAWGLVLRAMRNSGYHSQDEFKKLPPTIQKIVGSPSTLREWGLMPTDTVQTVIQSNFMRSYSARVKHDQEYEMIPENIKQVVGQIAGNMSMNKQLESGGENYKQNSTRR